MQNVKDIKVDLCYQLFKPERTSDLTIMLLKLKSIPQMEVPINRETKKMNSLKVLKKHLPLKMGFKII